MMTKRSMTFGSYNTAANGWTLAAWQLSPATPKTKYVDKTGGDGSWDMTTTLTDGLVRYSTRTLSVTLESSEGDRLSREDMIRTIVNDLDGQEVDIFLPDDELHHLTGRLHVARSYNDMAHAQVTVTAVCQPWKFRNSGTKIDLEATSAAQKATLVNNGRRAVVPTITIEEEVLFTYGTASISLSAGDHQWPDLLLTPGRHELTYKGAGAVRITYREAVLE